MFLSNFSAWLTRQVKQERRKQAQLEDLTQTFILEPIYTPGGLLDGGDDSEGLDLDPLDDMSDSPDWNGEDDLDLDGDDGGDEVMDEGDDSLDNDGEIVEDPVDLDDDVSDEEIGDEIPFPDESEEGETDGDEEISDELDESEEGESETDEEISDELDESEEGESETDEEISDELDESEETEAETDDDISDEGDDEEAGEAEADDDGEDNEDESEDPLDDEEDGEDEEEDEDDDELPFSFSVLDFDRGVFRVGDSGEVGVDFLFDGGAYQGEVAFFSLAGLEEMEFETTEQFIAEAAKRAASGSAQGHTVISVADEGARFTGSLFNEPDWNTGPYQGVKTFNMTPGDEFGVMLVPNGRVSDVVSNPSIGGSRRPLFSLSTANPDDEFHLGQIADLTGDGNTFVFEDKRFEISDYDYDDVIFQIRGAVGDAVYVGDVIAPDLDWRDDDMGKALLAYAKPYITPVNNEQWDLGELAEFGDEAMNSGDDLPSSGGGSETEVDLDDLDEVTTEEAETDSLDEAEDEVTNESDESDESDVAQASQSNDSTADSDSSDSSSTPWPETSSNESDSSLDDSTESTADPSPESSVPVTDEAQDSEGTDAETTDKVEVSQEDFNSSDDEIEETSEEFSSVSPAAEPQPLETPTRFEFAKEDQPLVGVIDTGFAENNPDLDYDNITLGRDWVDGNDNPLLAEGEGNEHGTHILGIIAAQQDNGIGIDGINPHAPIWLGRAVGSGEWANSLVEFVDAAVESGQPNAVVNLSMDLTQMDAEGNVTTRYEFTPQEREALGYARQNGVLLVVAAGNNADVMSVLGQASQEFDNIITVGAAEQFDPETSVWKGAGRTEYSSYGRGLDVMAYGGTVDNPRLSLTGDGLGTMAGSSVATAKVTGAVSQVWAANPELSYRQVVEIIKNTATDLGSTGWNPETGAGLLNMTAAVHLAKATKPEEHEPEPWFVPDSWSGEGRFSPMERAVDTVWKGEQFAWEVYPKSSGNDVMKLAEQNLGSLHSSTRSFIMQYNQAQTSYPNKVFVPVSEFQGKYYKWEKVTLRAQDDLYSISQSIFPVSSARERNFILQANQNRFPGFHNGGFNPNSPVILPYEVSESELNLEKNNAILEEENQDDKLVNEKVPSNAGHLLKVVHDSNGGRREYHENGHLITYPNGNSFWYYKPEHKSDKEGPQATVNISVVRRPQPIAIVEPETPTSKPNKNNEPPIPGSVDLTPASGKALVGKNSPHPHVFREAYDRINASQKDIEPIGSAYRLGDGWIQKYKDRDGNEMWLMLENGASQAWWVIGSNLEEYKSLGGPQGNLGYPWNDETPFDYRNQQATWQGFAGTNKTARIHHLPGKASVATWGLIGQEYTNLGGAAHWLGMPTRREYHDGDTIFSDFEGGKIAYQQSTGKIEVLQHGTSPSWLQSSTIITQPANFNKALAFVHHWEGGYVNHPNDSGGPTNKGITQNTYNAYRASKGLPAKDVRGITDAEVNDIYYTRYWIASGSDQLTYQLAMVHFDTAVNMGVGRASSLLQQARQSSSGDEMSVVHRYLDLREARYRAIVANDPSQGVFLNGWLNRLNSLRAEVETISGSSTQQQSTGNWYYYVKSGDTPSGIAQRELGNANRWREIRKADGTPLTDWDATRLQIDQKLILPGGSLDGGGESNSAGSNSKIVERAKRWVDLGIPYSWNNYYEGYRQDCSGLVSMAWQLPTSAVTSTLPNYSTTLSDKNELQPGDAINNRGLGADGHVVLFVRWVDNARGKFIAYEQNGGHKKAVQTQLTLSPYGSGYVIDEYSFISKPWYLERKR